MIQKLLSATAILLLAVVTPPVGADADMQDRLVSLVADAFDEGGPGGVVIVRREGQTLLHDAYGMADVELQVPMTTAHRLAAGSITKPMTAAGILRLIEEGRLALDDDVRAYLPSLSPGEHKITIEQLLSHTSGFPSAVDREDFEALARQDMTTEALLALTEGMTMHFAPGTGYRYSDSGYFLLGAVIEEISGFGYAEFMHKQVFEPNGLLQTVYGNEAAIIPRRASGYSRNEDGLINAPYINMSVPYAAGGIYTTAEDLANWIEVLRASRFIGPNLLNRAWAAQRLPDGTTTGYGFGWGICEIAGQRSIGHGGFINGFTANLEHLPDANITIAVMTNQDSGEPEASYLARRIARLLLTGRPDLPVVALKGSERARLLGTFAYENGDTRVIFEEGDALWSRRNDGEPIRLVPLSSSDLAFPDTEGSYGLEFVGDAQGQVARVVTRLKCSPLEVAERRSDGL